MNSSLKNNKNKKFGFLGMRVIKTFLAVHLCFVIAFLRKTSPLYSVFATIISMKADTEESIATGLNRVIGTIIGGLFGLITLTIIEHFHIDANTYAHYLLLSVLLIPVIYANVHLYSPSSTTISCVVFIGIAIIDTVDISIVHFAIERVIETSIGVVVAIIINSLL